MKNINKAIIVTFIVVPFLLPQISQAKDLLSVKNHTAENISSKIVKTKSASKENLKSKFMSVSQTRSVSQEDTTPRGGVLFL